MINEPVELNIREYFTDETGQYSKIKTVQTSGTPMGIKNRARSFYVTYCDSDVTNIRYIQWRGQRYKVKCCLPGPATCFIVAEIQRGK
jgi:hypothetical protein